MEEQEKQRRINKQQQILEYLKSNGVVTNDALGCIALRYGAYLKTLRDLGHNIETIYGGQNGLYLYEYKGMK